MLWCHLDVFRTVTKFRPSKDGAEQFLEIFITSVVMFRYCEVSGLHGVEQWPLRAPAVPSLACVKQRLRPPAQSFRRWLFSQSSSLSDCNFKITVCFSRTWQNFSKTFKIVLQKSSFLLQLKMKRRRKSGLKWTACLGAGFLFRFFLRERCLKLLLLKMYSHAESHAGFLQDSLAGVSEVDICWPFQWCCQCTALVSHRGGLQACPEINGFKGRHCLLAALIFLLPGSLCWWDCSTPQAGVAIFHWVTRTNISAFRENEGFSIVCHCVWGACSCMSPVTNAALEISLLWVKSLHLEVMWLLCY